MVEDPLPPISLPSDPSDILDHFEAIDFGVDPKVVYWCAHDSVFFILRTEMERYVSECEAAPSWQKPKPKKGVENVKGN